MTEFLQSGSWTAVAVGVVLLAAVAWIANAVTKRVLLVVIQRVAVRTASTWDDRLIERKVFHRIANVAPALVTYFGIGLAVGVGPERLAALAAGDAAVAGEPLVLTVLVVRRVALAFVVLSATMAFSAFLAAVDDIYRETYAEAKERPIKGYLQVLSIVVWIAAVVVMVALLADRSPVVFLSGLGALTAVLLLVFRDTILSLVASVQLMSNDMIRIGDWVEMPRNNADGDVIDIALHTVKIQNWDKTITTVPTHKFISESFKNWRGMSESGGRRIKRALHLDLGSVRFLTGEEIDRLSRYELLRDYMRRKREELAGANDRDPGDEEVIPEQRRLTNVGTFRAYVFEYLKSHPGIHREMTLLVRQLPPGPEGLPLELYCFTNDTAWARYEAIQADVFDHLLAILPEFGLRAFQKPAGSDLERVGAAADALPSSPGRPHS